MNLSIIQQELIKCLNGAQAHIPCLKIIQDFPSEKINTPIDEVPYTAWQIVEHMRLTQRDILDYMKDPDYKEPDWPQGYWPAKDKTATTDDWNNSIKQFHEDLKSLEEIIMDPQTDFTAPLVHNPKHTIFREILIIGNHNSYHGGQLLIFKRVLKIY
jgi:hypothetical protein